MKWLFLPIICLFVPVLSLAQIAHVLGYISDDVDLAPLVGVTISLQQKTNNFNRGTSSDENGSFDITDIPPGQYHLTIAFIGYKKQVRIVNLKSGNNDLGNIKLHRESTILNTVTVKEKQIRVQQLGDTSQFNADAYKVNPDATVEDLLKKMPGITSDNDGIKSNGEDIKKVLVDGKPFFGDDPNAALKNLPAEIVDKIQVFDNQSEQARFTGFRDANTEKALNILTKNGKNAGRFGKVYGGYGTDNKYNAGGNINIFNGDRRISVLALSNNVNQQNFSISDIMNVMSNSGDRGSGGSMGPPPGMRNNNTRQNNSSTFGFGPGGLLVGQQSGITATQSAGVNYTDSWGKKVTVSGSYFFNYTDNNNESELTRHYYTDTSLSYAENTTKHTINQNHRLNLKLEYAIDPNNKITLAPKITIQNNRYHTILSAATNQSGSILGTTDSRDSAGNTGHNFSNSLLYQHKFRKKGRTVSLAVNTQLNGRTGSGSYYSLSEYERAGNTSLLDQQYTLTSNDYTVSGTLSYTEPLSTYSQLMYSYTPSVSRGKANKETMGMDNLTETYTHFDTALSNKYNNNYQSHKNGLSYRFQKGKTNFSMSADVQTATLNGEQDFPVSFTTSRRFNNILPSASFNYRIGKTENIFIDYRTNTNIPTLTQLQHVVDVSNPLQLSSGNPNLSQTYEHTLMMRYGRTNSISAKHFFVFAMGNYTSDYISNTTFIPVADTIINNYIVQKGSQLTLPVNLDGYWSGKTFAVYGLPVGFLKSNLNINTGINYSRTPALINNILNYSNSFTVNGGVYLGSNISEQLDFSLSYNGSYNVVHNSVQTQSDNSYYRHNAGFKINWIVYDNIVLATDLTHTLYSGLGASYNQDFFLWNASVGYKFLKNKLEAKLYVFDLLNQNLNVSRTITETYTQDNRANVLSRYGMLSLTYTIRKFKNGSTQPENNFPHPPPGMPPPHMD